MDEKTLVWERVGHDERATLSDGERETLYMVGPCVYGGFLLWCNSSGRWTGGRNLGTYKTADEAKKAASAHAFAGK